MVDWCADIIGAPQIEQANQAEPEKTGSVMNLTNLDGRETKILIPLIFDKEVRKLSNHTLVFELETTMIVLQRSSTAQQYIPEVELRTILNINELD